MKKAIYIMREDRINDVYDQETQQNILNNFEMIGKPLTRENCLNFPELLSKVEIIFTGWGGPIFDEKFIQATPKLKAIFYGAGSMKDLITTDVWAKGITVVTANSVNAIPVAEYTLSQILFSLKNGWQMVRGVRKTKNFQFDLSNILGTYNRTVGLISLSSVGRKTLELLQPYDLNIVAYDPFVTEKEAKELGVKMVLLKKLFEMSDIVSLHTPLLPETRGMITGNLFHSMKENTTFINSARGAIIKENELIEVLKQRKDLTAILDVTYPEPPDQESPLFDLDNVVLTPHIAGSAGSEIARMGRAMYEEAMRYINNTPLKYEITREQFQNMA